MKKSLLVVSLLSVPAASSALEYEKDIQPIFEQKCYDCHSDEGGKIKGGLKLDDSDHFFERFSKNDVIVPGDWDASYLFVTVTRPQHAKEAMPPKGKGDSLTPDEIMKVANWIHEGAKVGRKSGEKGPDDWLPEKLLRFDDAGQLVIVGFSDEAPAPMMEETKVEPEFRDWTNFEGVKIRAKLMGVEDGNALLEVEDGRTARYPLEKLSEESQATIKELSAEMHP